jgi:cytochrome c oxidase subunit 1
MTYDYYYGYLYRNIHILLATTINILLIIHIFKGLLYNNLSNQIYIHYSGFILYILLIIISYLGYILTYGQLSFWGATVIINLLPISLGTLILGSYGISSITINRYLIFHMLLTLILYVFIIIHIFYLHQLSSQSPLPISILSTSGTQLHITFQHFILKDLTSLLILLTIVLLIALFILINLSHSNNLIPINPLSTPQHLVPESYFLYLYAILKIIPSKLGGILTVILTILFILLLTTSNWSYNLYNTNSININNYNNIDTVITIFFTYIYLSYIGLQLPIAPYLLNLRYFLLYLPVPVIIISLLSNISFMKKNFSLFYNHNNNYIGLISTTNHKRIGLYYLLTGAYISIIAILLSIIMRLELYSPTNNIINISNISFYNYSITNHGLLMLLFVVMPILFSAYGNYLLVLTIGLIDIIFPRINNFGYLVIIISWLLIQIGILTEYLTGTGWTLYPPLSIITSTYLISTIYISLAISGISSLLTSANYLLLFPYILHITDLLFISYSITSLMILYTFPVLAGAFLLAVSDILFTTTYFSGYSDPVVFQHLFWWFGHPEVYVLIIPSFGLINYTLSQYTSNYIFGSISMILALISILIFGSIVYGHHMFVVNMESDTNLYYSILTLVIAIPTGTKLYNWLFLIYSYPYNFTHTYNLPLLLSFIFLLMVIQGGITGIVLGNNILDIQLHDTYYVVAHFHYILSIGSILSVFLTLIQLTNYISPIRLYYYYYSCLDITYLSIIYLLLNIIFLPHYYLGFNTMPRRIPDYADYLFTWNSISTIGVISLYIMFFILIISPSS